ncbi:hypothetical protein [Demequina mangrovi]|uniref:Uncharacterized protein n=1 Tax=Demequina mangrovi TaxID=1043493 RepID=A0A1H6XFR6_9MICO|nr:hypothetical protein [Demequina mangrovi]SEJ23710.1 hypothetical protein SAMN05421637_1272 [Demequina mangrovi]
MTTHRYTIAWPTTLTGVTSRFTGTSRSSVRAGSAARGAGPAAAGDSLAEAQARLEATLASTRGTEIARQPTSEPAVARMVAMVRALQHLGRG